MRRPHAVRGVRGLRAACAVGVGVGVPRQHPFGGPHAEDRHFVDGAFPHFGICRWSRSGGRRGPGASDGGSGGQEGAVSARLGAAHSAAWAGGRQDNGDTTTGHEGLGLWIVFYIVFCFFCRKSLKTGNVLTGKPIIKTVHIYQYTTTTHPMYSKYDPGPKNGRFRKIYAQTWTCPTWPVAWPVSSPPLGHEG